MKKTLTQKQIDDYKQLCCDRNNGRLLAPQCQRSGLIPASSDKNAFVFASENAILLS